jgi:hypothetical protein
MSYPSIADRQLHTYTLLAELAADDDAALSAQTTTVLKILEAYPPAAAPLQCS